MIIVCGFLRPQGEAVDASFLAVRIAKVQDDLRLPSLTRRSMSASGKVIALIRVAVRIVRTLVPLSET